MPKQQSLTSSHLTLTCPACGSGDAPKLIVQGLGGRNQDAIRHCRSCGHEWTALRRAESRAS